MADNEVTAQVSPAPAESDSADKTPVALHPPQPAKRPKKFLPTLRISFAKQLDILRAYDAASKQGVSPVTLADVERVVKMAVNTISLTSAFFVEIGLIKRTESGRFLPSPAVHEYALAYQWSAETAAQKLAPIFRHSWAYEALSSALSFRQSIPEAEAIGILAQAIEASPDYKSQLDMVLSYLAAAGLVQRDGTMVRYVLPEGPAAPPSSTVSQGITDEASAAVEERPTPARPAAPVMSTSFSSEPSGVVQFVVNVRVEMSEMRNWKADRIAAFFGGIAQVLAAKGAVEQEASDIR